MNILEKEPYSSRTCLDLVNCEQRKEIATFDFWQLELPPPPIDNGEVEYKETIAVKNISNETQNFETQAMIKVAQKENGSNEFTLTQTQADAIGLPFIAGKYIFIELNGQEINKEWLFVSDQTATKLKELLSVDVKQGYYQKPIAEATESTPKTKWYQNKWVIVGACATAVGVAHYLSNGSNGLSGFLGGFGKGKNTKKDKNKNANKKSENQIYRLK